MIRLEDVEQARERMEGYIKHTPCIRAEWLESLVRERLGSDGFLEADGFQVWLKLETMQQTASFKERGSFNKIWVLTENGQKTDVKIVTASAGNHAQGVARAAKYFGVDAKIVMPTQTPEVKVENTKRLLGEHPTLYGDDYDAAVEEARRLEREDGRTMVHAFNDSYVIAGQGTVGLEILEDLPGVQVIVAGVGGGGLIAGIAVAVKTGHPHINVIGVESSAQPAACEARRTGQVQSIKAGKRRSIADGIAVEEVGEETLPVIKDDSLVNALLLVDEPEIARAMYLLHTTGEIVAEGACAVTVAALLDPRYAEEFRKKKVVLVLSGGNVDKARLARITEWHLFNEEIGCEVQARPYDAGVASA